MIAIPGKSMAVHLLIHMRMIRSHDNLNSNFSNMQHLAVYTCYMPSIRPCLYYVGGWQWSRKLMDCSNSMLSTSTMMIIPLQLRPKVPYPNMELTLCQNSITNWNWKFDFSNSILNFILSLSKLELEICSIPQCVITNSDIAN